MTIPRKTRADLARENIELRAQLASTYHFASREIPKAHGLMGSGVLLTLTVLGGREITKPVLIRDGLSEETVGALLRDIARSYDDAVALKPKAAPSETVTVVCQNDYPIAVHRTEEAAKTVQREKHDPDNGIHIHLHPFALP